jgi:DNA polymerase III sliding clamp (beta) subunit (PCNA family)
MNYSMFKWVLDIYKNFSGAIENTQDFESVNLRKIDYSYMVSECSKFVSDDSTRYFMNGICFDFTGGGKDFIHMIATDGKKMCLLKQAASHREYPADSKEGRFIVPPSYLGVPGSEFSSAVIRLSKQFGQIVISTEYYHFEGMFECIEGDFPHYKKVSPAVTDKTEWFTLCAASLRVTINSVKSLMDRKGIIYLNAENPESMNITVAEGQQTLEIEGTASRPMRLSFVWEHLSACLFDGLALTKFRLNGADEAFVTHEANAVKGLTLDVTKLFMPVRADAENLRGCDKFHVPVKDNAESESSESSLPSFVTGPETEPDSDDPESQDDIRL